MTPRSRELVDMVEAHRSEIEHHALFYALSCDATGKVYPDDLQCLCVSFGIAYNAWASSRDEKKVPVLRAQLDEIVACIRRENEERERDRVTQGYMQHGVFHPHPPRWY